MPSKTITERIFAGREAELRLNDPYLNEKLEMLAEKWMRGIVSATPSQTEEVLEAKRRIDAITDLRKALKIELDDGELAKQEQDENGS